MASVDDIDELIATRRLNGVDDGLYESDKNVVNMTEEAFNEIIDNLEVVAYLTEYGRRGRESGKGRVSWQVQGTETNMIIEKGRDIPGIMMTVMQRAAWRRYLNSQRKN